MSRTMIHVYDHILPLEGEEGRVLQDVRHDDGAARRRDDQSEIPRAEANNQVGNI